MQLEIGQIVASRAGRDVAHLYAVVGLQEERVLVADGDKRLLAAPKAKNLKHIAPTLTVLKAEQMQTDVSLRKALAEYTCESAPNAKEDG